MSAEPVVVVLAAVAGAGIGRLADTVTLVAPRWARSARDAPPSGEESDGAPVSAEGAAVRAPERVEPGRWGRAFGAPWPELLGAGVVALVVWRFGSTPLLPAWLWFAALGLVIALVDLRVHLVLDRVLLPGLAVSLLLLAGAALVQGDTTDLVRACLAAITSFGVLLVMALVTPSGMGMGDVKLAALLGLHLGWLGWPVVLAGFLLAFLLQAVVGLVLLVGRRVGRRAELPFGPTLLAGTLAAAVLHAGGA